MTIPDIFSVTEERLLQEIEAIVTKTSNPSVHRMSFASILINSNENIQDYVIRLRSSAPDCEFVFPSCAFEISDEHIKDIHTWSAFKQTDILAKASQLTLRGTRGGLYNPPLWNFFYNSRTTKAFNFKF